MTALNDRIINELQRTEVKNLSRLINFMNGEKGFFWVRSGGHDHWTNGTAQHSWRVYQYMRYMWEHPEMIPCNRAALRNPSHKAEPALAPDKVRALTESEIILTGLLHDVGKMWGLGEHEKKSRTIIDKYLGKGFSERNPQIVAAIYFHHKSGKNGGFLNAYKDTTLKKLLNIADSLASGTTWNSTRFNENRSQRHGVFTSDIKHLRRGAMDRTRQVLDYKMFLDYTYNLQTISGYASKDIAWNTHSEMMKELKSGMLKGVPLPDKVDYITAAHRYQQEEGRSICLVVGIDLSVTDHTKRSLRQEAPSEEELLICSNAMLAFYNSTEIRVPKGNHGSKKSHTYKYTYTMRDEIKQHYQNQSSDKGIFLPQVTFFRDGASEGFRMVAPWTCDVLLVPGWKGCVCMER